MVKYTIIYLPEDTETQKDFLKDLKQLTNTYKTDIETSLIAEWLPDRIVKDWKQRYGINDIDIIDAWFRTPEELTSIILESLYWNTLQKKGFKPSDLDIDLKY